MSSNSLSETSVSSRDTFARFSPLAIDFMNNLLERSESYKFIRMADDLHDVARYLNDMRLCFIALTITGYLVMIVYGIIFCVRRNRRRPAGVNNNGAARRGRWDYQAC
uniref:t-SNARE coiled-coil homology domain-containing protein n=1 Tax=Ascaris lumbricoides TaxID=6252 RepID=A0A0M3HGM8_ASCLU